MQSPSASSETKLSTNASQLIKALLDSLAAEKSLSKQKDDKIAELEKRILSLNDALGPKKGEQLISTENKEPTKKETKYITEEEYLNGMKEYREKFAAHRKLVKEAIAKHIYNDELFHAPERPFPLFPKRHVKHRWFKPNKVFYDVSEEE